MSHKEKIQKFSLESFSGGNNLKEFHDWLQENMESFNEAELDFALPLIEVDLKSNKSNFLFINKLREQYQKFFGPNLEQDRAKHILKKIVQESGDIVTWCHELSNLLSAGADFLPIEFKGFSSELDDVPLNSNATSWNKIAFEEKRRKVDLYADAIKSLAAKTLSQLKN